MIDLTPLDIRKKKKDFTRVLRGYEPREVDHFLDTVAERLEEVVKLNLTLRERVDRLAERVQGQEGRERAVQEALVTAQSLKHDIQEQAKREAELIMREAESAAENVRDAVKGVINERRRELVELNRARSRFLKGFRSLLERELDAVEVAETSPGSDELDLDVLQFGRTAARIESEESEVLEAAAEVSEVTIELPKESELDESVETVALAPTVEEVAETEVAEEEPAAPQAEVEIEGAVDETAAEEEGEPEVPPPATGRSRAIRERVSAGDAADSGSGAEEERWGAR
jgi:cell division initiation protein